jgi:eukaryotic-like serine/threonine-protein kinase
MKDFFRYFISKTFLFNILAIGIILFAIIYGTLSYLNSYTKHGEEITVPDFRGKTVEEIEDMITEKRLRYIVIDSVYDDVLPKGAIVDQNPTPMDRVKENRRIYFTVNAILPPLVTLPNLKDKSKRQAIAILDVIGVGIDSLKYVPDICEDCVLKVEYQGKEINSGTKLEKGRNIVLVLGAGQNGGRTLLPSLIGMNHTNVKDLLTDLSLNLGTIRFDETVLSDR